MVASGFSHRRRDRQRKATLSIELLFVLPILLIVLFGTVQFALWLTAQQRLDLASREGARVAATGGNQAAVTQIVGQVLGEERANLAEVQAVLTDSMGNPLASGQPVSVTVILPARTVIPDVLHFIGLSIQGRNLVSQTVMRKE